MFVHLSRRRDAWTAKLVLYNTEAKGCTTDKKPWYVSAVKGLATKWEHETFGKRNVVERWFFYIKHRIKRFYKRFPWNAKYETVYRMVSLLYCHLYHHGAKKFDILVLKL
jgi:transposase-like protein